VSFRESETGGVGGTGAVAAKMAAEKEKAKWATCKQCGTRVLRTLEAIEQHDEICESVQVRASQGKRCGQTYKQGRRSMFTEEK